MGGGLLGSGIRGSWGGSLALVLSTGVNWARGLASLSLSLLSVKWQNSLKGCSDDSVG